MIDIDAALAEIDPLLQLIVRERIGSQSWLRDDALQEARIRAWTRLSEGHSIGIAVHASKQAVIDVCRGGRMTGSKQAGIPVTRTVPLLLPATHDGGRDEYTFEPADPSAEADFEAVDEDAEALLDALLAPLSAGERRALLGTMEGLTVRQMAETEGVSHQGISHRLKQARAKLQHLGS